MTPQWLVMAQWGFDGTVVWDNATVCHGVTACNGVMVCHGVQWCDGATVCNGGNDPKTAATMLYRGISGTIGGVNGIDTDINNVIWQHQCGLWGCYKVLTAQACPWCFGEGTQQQRLVI